MSKNKKKSFLKRLQIKIKFLFGKVKRIILLSMLSLSGCLIVFVFYSYLTLPPIKNVFDVTRTPKITLLADDNTILSSYGSLYYQYIPYENLPPHLIHAIIATEDRRFFSHNGIDIKGIIRALLVNLNKNKAAQGGSTITQQLARNLFLNSQKTLKRKLQEVMLAFKLEQQLSKKEIISLYLNKAYLGSGVYGVSGAAKYYFNKEIKNITTPEAAIIAGLLKAPSRYNPHFSKENSIKRGNIALKNMLAEGYITPQQYQQYAKTLKNAKSPIISHLQKNHFTDWIIDQLKELFIAQDQDLIIKTTLNRRLQKIAQSTISLYLEKEGKQFNVDQAAMIALDSKGQILAMIGGKEYQIGGFNRATYAKRQPGSLFKIFTYITAFENGFFPDDLILDAPINIGKWAPKNNTSQYYGEVTLKESFALSLNTAAVRLAEIIGREEIINTAKKLGIESEIQNQPSLSLGSFETNLLEITSSFACIMADGYQVIPFGIKEIQQANGKTLFHKESLYPEKLLSDHTIVFSKELLKEVIETGSGKLAHIHRNAYGKTGTSQLQRDGWFIGFDDQYTVGIWMGNDNNSPTKLYGGTLPARLWAYYMSQI
jgi:penicillin-binding protein 1A